MFTCFVWFCFFLCLLFVLHGDSSMDYVSIQFSSLLSHIVIMTNVACHCINSVNLHNAIKTFRLDKRPGESHLALDGKKKILNSGRHTQPDPQSCRVRSLGGRRGESKNKQRIKTVRRPIVTKRSTANANTEKSIPPAMSQQNQHLTPTPCCESLRQQHPNNSRQHGALAKIGNMQAGLETFNQQPCSPESCHSVTLARVLLFVSCAIFRKKGHCSNLIFGAVNTLAFWTPRSSPPQYTTRPAKLPR